MIAMTSFLGWASAGASVVFLILAGLSRFMHGIYWRAGEDPDMSENVYQAATLFLLTSLVMATVSIGASILQVYLMG